MSISIPKYDEIYREILQAVSDGETHSIIEVREKVSDLKRVAPEARKAMLESGNRTVFDDRVGWARTYLRAAGLIDYPRRGFTQITEAGRKVLSENPAKLDNDYLRKFESFVAFQSRSKKDENSSNATPEQRIDESNGGATPAERMETAFSEMNSSLGIELLSEIMRQPPVFFENLVVKLLVSMGYGGSLGDEAGQVTRFTNDEGIDGVIREDKLGFSNIYIQAKRWAIDKKVSRPDIQAFVGAIANKAGKGLFITTAGFSDGARQCAKENHIVLIDGGRLTALMIEHGVGVSTMQTYEIKRIDSDFFAE